MAKKKLVTFRIEFEGSGVVLENVIVKVVPFRNGEDRHYFNIDKKPNGWLMLVTEGFLNADNQLWPVEVMRYDGEMPQFLVRNGCACPVSIYNVLTTFHAKEFYHLDQLPDSTFRIVHSVRMFPKDFKHNTVERITFTAETV